MTRSRKRTLFIGALTAAAALTASACGGGDGDSGKGPGDGGTRTVQTAMGAVKVPEQPERVVVLDTAELDSALTLGVKPVGATRSEVDSGFLSYLPEDWTKGIKDVGSIGQPNLEAVAALKPDLILSNMDRDKQRYDELAKIAPTVLTKTTGYPWKENFQVHAEALDKKKAAAGVVADYKARAKGVTDALGGPEKAGATEVSMVRFVEGADTRLYGKQNYLGTVFADVGLGRPKVQDVDEFMVEVSPEQIDKADGDVIFHATYGDPGKAREKEITTGRLWKNLGAVKAGRVFAVEDQLWVQGIGYTAAGKILDQLRQDLAGTG